ncbi:MAG: hypothetical protein RL621_1606, partial [Bacteroidota bacterium]
IKHDKYGQQINAFNGLYWLSIFDGF